jgi:hypothetical protein
LVKDDIWKEAAEILRIAAALEILADGTNYNAKTLLQGMFCRVNPFGESDQKVVNLNFVTKCVSITKQNAQNVILRWYAVTWE